MAVNTAQVGNWITETCSTAGTGDLILTGPADQTRLKFVDVLPSGGTVWYSISDGINRESGIGTFIPPATIQRTTIFARKAGTTYTPNPAPLPLSGASFVSSTFNAAALDDIVAEVNSHFGDGTLHFTVASIDHDLILNVGSNDHTAIDTHIADTTIHFTKSSINITDLGDVFSSMTPTDSQVLTYDSINGWQAEATQEVAGDKVREIITQATHGFTVGQPLYFNGTVWALAKADVAATVGTVICEEIDANSFYAVTVGDVPGMTGLVTGDWYYVSTAAAGVLTNVAPTVAILNPVGYAQSATNLHVMPLRASDTGVYIGGTISHVDLNDIGVQTHPTIDTHLGDATKHRIINDAGTTTTELFSASKIIAELGLKADLNSPTFTGTPSMPTGTVGVTQTAGDSSLALATTAFVAGEVSASTPGIDDNADAVAMTITINEEIGFGETVPAVQYHFRDGDVGALGVPLTSGNFSTIFETNSVISGIAVVGQDNQHARMYIGERNGTSGFELHVDSTGTSPLFKITEGSSGSRQLYIDNKSLTIFQPIAWEQDVKALADVDATLQSFELFDRGTFTIAPTVPRILTTDTAANIRAEVTGQIDKTSFQFSIVNTGPNTATLAAGASVTLVGNLVVAANDSATFKIIFTSTTAVTIYRI